ncbi:MAG TPA: MFS transporter [Ktedonobacterales bacterium]|nr:MFS transporter [Ktedonobacterales bacterium]
MLAQRLGLPRIRGYESFVIATLIDFLGSGLYLPFSLLYFHQVVGLPLPAAGLAFSVATAIALPLVPLSGILIDHIGPKQVVVASQVLQGAGIFGYLIVTNVPMLIGMALLESAGQCLFWSAHFSLMSQLAAPNERDRWFGLGAATRNTGIGLGGLLAGVLVGANAVLGYHLVIVANGISYVIAACLLIFGVRITAPLKDSGVQSLDYRVVLRDRPFLLFVVTNIIFALCSLLLAVGLPVYIVDGLHAPVWLVGVLVAMSTVLIASLQTVVVRLMEPYRRTRALVLCGLLWAGWCAILASALLVPKMWLLPALIVATCVFALAELIHDPTSNALAAETAPEALRGRYLAIFQLSWRIAAIFAPGMFTLLFAFHPVAPWLVVAGLISAASLMIIRIEPRLPKSAVRIRVTTGG